MASGDMYDFFGNLVRMLATRNAILDKLPESNEEACTIICTVVDEFFIRKGINPIKGWKILNDVAAEVHSEFDMEDEQC